MEGRIPRIVGSALVAPTGLLVPYAGNPRLPRAYAAAHTCTVTSAADTTDPGTLRKALVDFQAGDCLGSTITIDTTGTLDLLSDLPHVDFRAASLSAVTSLTINGKSGFIIDCGGSFDGIYVADSFEQIPRRHTYLDQLEVTGAHTYVLTDLTTDHSSFANSSYARGGGIYVFGDATINYSNFSKNVATGAGGAVKAGGDVTIDHSGFLDNSASGDAGAVYGRSVTISHSGFIGNSSGGTGGAVYADNKITVSDSTFTANDATHGLIGTGGALLARGGVEVTGSTLTGNSAKVSGGAVYTWSSATVRSSTFSDNAAIFRGGAIYAHGELITNSTFAANNAYQGGV